MTSRSAVAASLCLFALAIASEARSASPDDCLVSLAKVIDPPVFAAFPANRARSKPPARPRLTSPDARMFRSVLREAAARGPNFANHYAIAVWGCGSSCSDMAIVDTASGQVYFDRRIRDVSGVRVSDDPNMSEPEYIAARFRRDSRLLVLVGAPAEDDAQDGVHYFEWTGSALKLLRFVPRSQACMRAPAAE